MEIVKGKALRFRFKARVAIAFCLLALLYSALMIAVGATMHKNAFFADSIMPYVRASGDWPLKRIKGFTARPEHLEIHISWQSLQRLSYQRERALDLGTILVADEDSVPAIVKHRGKDTRVKIRLKGDGIDHLRGEKWSFRVRVRGDGTLLGMKQFSLHHPRVRNWVYEWLCQRAMRREDIVSLRYKFVDLSLNGKSLGIYALEEHFEKRLIESNRRREGPIIRFNEDLMWREIVHQLRPFRGSRASGAGEYLASDIDGFQTSRSLGDELLREQYLHAVHLLEAFRRGDAPTGDVFDTGLLATYFALVDLFGAEHGSRWNNIRFYYNPVTAMLEPIAFDLIGGRPTKALSLAGTGTFGHRGELIDQFDHFHRTLFADPAFCEAYLSELHRVSSKEWLEAFLADNDSDLNDALAILYREYPYYEFSSEVLHRNREFIRSVLNPVRGLQAYWKGHASGTLGLRLGNIQILPVEVLGVEFDGLGFFEPTSPVVLPPRQRESPVKLQEIAFDLPKDLAPSSLIPESARVRYRIPGTPELRTAPVIPYDLNLEPFLAALSEWNVPNVDEFEFLEYLDDRKILRVKAGNWTLRRDLIVPPGLTFECGPGTTLDLLESSMVISRSPLRFAGTAESPIRIISSDGSGEGLAVLGAGAASTLQHVVFDGLAAPSREGWSLTGAVTFYESPVAFSQVSVLRSRCEDGINVIRSAFTLDQCLFQDMQGDAFDADFAEGTITRSTAKQCGNDAIDVSGSMVRLEQVTIEACGDKAISVGEASRLVAENLKIDGARVGVASKDASEVLINDAVIANCEYGLVAYQKKSEFGPGRVEAFGIQFENVRQRLLVENGSTVLLEGVVQPQNSEDVRNLVYGDTQAAAVSRD